ncbi:tetratricopeptide repeat protein [Pseudemcibacter aquimaris]|uniref:tetratricopeptide repeat protein n=1 Tax=Pseudemcibacter aquimaris TaxID=2857064 RepID=UPI00201184DD|nr:tetratricopeptide repeat protein [Pseudemcibacter aquimaris]MCC3861025.1 sel1 repeat family protein [Pseudemcibacter aquimaris]WDU59843.1 sel1 repeat family protein [Pseudemcibacter aquimaris]
MQRSIAIIISFIVLGTMSSQMTLAAPPCAKTLPDNLERYAERFTFLDQQEDQAALYGYYRCLTGRDHIEGQYRRGLAYEMGWGVKKNMKKAAYWYKMAADGDYIYSRTVNGIVEPRFRKGVIVGHAAARYRFGLMYLEGRGKEMDKAYSVIWFSRAAKQGHADAQYQLGLLLIKPKSPIEGIVYNIDKAKYWLSESAKQGHVEAIKVLTNLNELEKQK